MSDPAPSTDSAVPPVPPSSEGDLSGRHLGDFHLLRRLGRGAMAEVYLAEQERLKRRVAVKVLKPELASDRTYLQRFQLEAQAAASLVHANIVQIYEVGCVDQLHYIAQEYVHGQNLRDYVDRHGPLDLARALSVMRQVGSALAKAAERGVIHRDIKPENILLTGGGEVKVADFGLARITREAGNELTQVGITMGTPLYMSPEQVQGKPLDSRSDLYSLGVTCYQMLTGSPPFKGETVLGVAVQHLKNAPEPLESLRPDLPAALCRLVHQMLAKEPERRLASARDLLRELRRLQVEHFGENWPEHLPAWDSLAAELPADPRIALAQQLDQLMKAAAPERPSLARRALLAAALLAALAGGACAGWLCLPAPLLADAQAPSVIPKEADVKRQVYRAAEIGTEAAWQSVLTYFPENRYYTLRAEEQLALIYFRERKLAQAMETFEKLAHSSDDEAEVRAFGLAGMYGVLTLRGQFDQCDAVLNQLLPIRNRLKSEPMQRLLNHAIDRNRSKIGPQTAAQWDQWLKEQFHDE
jgi:serine/threonine-protein kinase